jgi:hypothetical protein
MTFEEIDNLVKEKLSIYHDVERRDYRDIESKDPIRFKGYGARSGLMYLVDVDGDHYIDINILTDTVKMVFRKDDDQLLYSTKTFDKTKEFLSAFLSLIEEEGNMMNRFHYFNVGKIPTDIIRNNKIKDIIS